MQGRSLWWRRTATGTEEGKGVLLSKLQGKGQDELTIYK